MGRKPKKKPRGRKGRVTIRSLSFHNDNIIDKYIVSGGGYPTIWTQSKTHANEIADARRRVIRKHTTLRARLRR